MKISLIIFIDLAVNEFHDFAYPVQEICASTIQLTVQQRFLSAARRHNHVEDSYKLPVPA